MQYLSDTPIINVSHCHAEIVTKGGLIVKLNPDCIRDILLTVEEIMIPDDNGRTSEITIAELSQHNNLSGYKKNEIAYTVLRLFDECMLKKGKTYIHEANPHIIDITTKGVQFIEATKSNSVWAKTKSSLASAVALTATKLLETAISIALN